MLTVILMYSDVLTDSVYTDIDSKKSVREVIEELVSVANDGDIISKVTGDIVTCAHILDNTKGTFITVNLQGEVKYALKLSY